MIRFIRDTGIYRRGQERELGALEAALVAAGDATIIASPPSPNLNRDAVQWEFDSDTQLPVGARGKNGERVDLQTVSVVTQAQVAAPTAAMLADTKAVYRLNVEPFTRYTSNGSLLVASGPGIEVETGAVTTQIAKAWAAQASARVCAFVYVGPFAGAPEAANYAGAMILVTDGGARPCEMMSNGYRWTALGPVPLPSFGFSSSMVKTDADGDWAMAWAASLPRGFMGPTGYVEIRPWCDQTSHASSGKQYQLMVNGTYPAYNKIRTTILGDSPLIVIENRHDVAKQQSVYLTSGGATGPTTNTVATSTATIDTDSVDFLMQFRVRHQVVGTGTERISVNSVRAIYYPE